MNLTTKQQHILALIKAGNPDGSPIDLDQLLARVPYLTTKQSMQFSIRALQEKGLIAKGVRDHRRGRSRRVFTMTALGLHWATLLCPPPIPTDSRDVLSDEELAAMERNLGLDDLSAAIPVLP